MTPEEIAIKNFPIHTSCPFKIKKITHQREQLIKDINEAIRLSTEKLRKGA